MTRKQQVAKSAAVIAIFTLMSKGLGFIREVMIASRFGSGMETDTYFVAMTATVMIMSILGSAMNTTLIPIFSEIGEKRGKEGRLRYLNSILNIIFFITLILAILAFVLSPLTIKILAKGFEGEQFRLAVNLNRIGLPIIIFLGFTHVLSGFLHSSQIFGPHAIMGIPYNAVFLVYLFFSTKNPDINMLMLISVIASATQFLIQIPAVKHLGFRYTLNVSLRDPYLRKALFLVFPVLIGSAVQQINVIIDKTLASELVEGSISALSYASRINDLIISVFIAAITTVVFPMLSKAFSKNDTNEVVNILNQGVNIIFIITVPATIGILILAYPMVQLFFQRGAFNNNAAMMTSGALTYYSIGLVATALRLMLNKVFYSLQDTKTPMLNGGIAVLINIVLNLILIKSMEHRGLALATSISAIITTILLFIDLRIKLGPLGISRMITVFIKTLLASVVMGFVVHLIYYELGGLLPQIKALQAALLLGSVALGVIVYFFTLILLRVKELRFIGKTIRRK
ncbi:murein biosynthesis integral membrane protein MurJ [Tissierella sp. Yu-01]|uniref:murein biosynthesis integral membrane protein MurJ n=1 Tax=Tissierella sp. Yu-01 TaxID=3035694 RepID=UPI00240D7D54|nr:murein biosynthesis integral membrane protein MurJ [Tissierella sp. Yu-01]WFA08623.1 murein biosynthesis integral membrane protein MurJ [Tissierella sp. Yu-01]